MFMKYDLKHNIMIDFNLSKHNLNEVSESLFSDHTFRADIALQIFNIIEHSQ